MVRQPCGGEAAGHALTVGDPCEGGVLPVRVLGGRRPRRQDPCGGRRRPQRNPLDLLGGFYGRGVALRCLRRARCSIFRRLGDLHPLGRLCRHGRGGRQHREERHRLPGLASGGDALRRLAPDPRIGSGVAVGLVAFKFLRSPCFVYATIFIYKELYKMVWNGLRWSLMVIWWRVTCFSKKELCLCTPSNSTTASPSR